MRIRKFFKTKYDVRRHLQDQHSGVGFQCSVCGYLFNRRNMRHSCNVGEEDMEYMVRATGAYGDEARKMLKTFIRDEQDNHWKYVEADSGSKSHHQAVKSVVVKPNIPARRPRPRKERDLSPVSLGEPEPISLEEPPVKVRCVETVSSASLLLDELACSPSLSSISSSEVSELETVETVKRKESEGRKEIENGQQIKKLKTIEITIDKLPEGKRKQNVTETQNKGAEQGKKTNNMQNEKNDKAKEKRKDKKRDETNGADKENENQSRVDKSKKTNKKDIKNGQSDRENKKDKSEMKECAVDNKQNKTDKQKEVNSDKQQKKNDIEKNVNVEENKNDRQKDVNADGKQKTNDKQEEIRTQTNINVNNLTRAESNKINLREEEKQTKKDTQNDKKNETKETEKEKYTKKISLKDYKARKENNKQIPENDIDNIMKDMTNTMESMRCISPIIDNQPGTPVIESPIIYFEPESPIRGEREPQGQYNNEINFDEPQGDITETMIAVASITDRTLEETVENYFNVMCNGATEVMEGNVVEQEIDYAIDCVYEERAEEERLRKEKERKRKAEKEAKEVEQLQESSEYYEGNKGEETTKETKEDKKQRKAEKRKLKAIEELKTHLEKIQKGRVSLNIGGRLFETSVPTLLQDPGSLFAHIFKDKAPSSYFFDRDPAHFRFIINYLRNKCQIQQATLPRERRYLLELHAEADYYGLDGLKVIVERRLHQFSDIGLEF